jgi:hypothetical protein
MLTKIQKKELVFQNEKVDIYKIKGAKYDRLEKKLQDGFLGLMNEEKEKIRVQNIYSQIKNLAYFHSVKKNVVCLAGRKRICRILAGETSITSKDTNAETFPNVCAIGTGTDAHTENSTTLHTEVFRKNIASREPKDNKLVVLSHYRKDDCEGNFKEEAIFMQGDVDTADSGHLLSVVTLDVTEGNKTSSDALIVERTFTLLTS